MRKLMLAAIVLLLLTNAVVLTGVAYNRSGEPLASVVLTERELSRPYRYVSIDEDSSTSLTLSWQILDTRDEPVYLYTRYSFAPAWLNEARLVELGFDIERLNSEKDRYRYTSDAVTADVILVLEYDGDTYQQALALAERKLNQLREHVKTNPGDAQQTQRLKQAEKEFTQLKISQSRLYAIDAGLDEKLILQKYTAKNKYLFVRGEIGVDWEDNHIAGRIRHLYIADIHVPLPYSQQILALTNEQAYYNDRKPIPPRYSLQLNIGQRMEPWVESVAAIKAGE